MNAALPSEQPARPRRVLFGLEPRWPGESLIGAVRRCAVENDLPSALPILAEACGSSIAFTNLAFRGDLDPERLAQSMRIAPEEVLRRLHPTVATNGATELVDFFGATIPASQLDLKNRRIAVAAFAAAPYHRALWHHSLIPFDGETGEILVDACPFCHRRLRWGGGGPIDLCNSCESVIRTTRGDRVSRTTLRRTAPMLALLDPDPARRGRALRDLHPDLATLDRGIAFELGRRLARAITCDGETENLRERRWSQDGMIQLLEIGGDMIAGWPDAPRRSAMTLLGTGGQASSAFMHAFRSIFNGREAIPEHLDLLRQTMPEMLEGSRAAARKLFPGRVTASAAERILGTHSMMFGRCVRAGGIEPMSTRGSTNLHRTFDAEALAEARDLLEDAFAFSSATERLGIPLAAVEALVAGGLLEEIRNPVVTTMRKDRILSRSSYEALLVRLHGSATPAIGTAISFRAALNHVGGRQKPWGAVFAAMVDGVLPFAMRDRTSRSQQFTDLVVVPIEVGPMVAEMTDEPDIVVTERSATMPRRDAEWMLNINPRYLNEAMRAELAPAVHGVGGLIVERVLDMARARIGGAEISARFMGGSRKLPDALRVGGLPRLGVTGWDRAAVEAVLSPVSAATAPTGPPIATQ